MMKVHFHAAFNPTYAPGRGAQPTRPAPLRVFLDTRLAGPSRGSAADSPRRPVPATALSLFTRGL
jgi:hypothetical protein